MFRLYVVLAVGALVNFLEVPLRFFHVSLPSSSHSFLLFNVFIIFEHSETHMEIILLHEYVRFLMKITHGILLELRKFANKICIGNDFSENHAIY